jgi:uncharacterized protein
MSIIQVEELTVAPGEKRRGILKVPGDHNPEYNPRIVVINGLNPGKTIAVTGGVHGTEYASIEAVTRFIEALDPSVMHGAVIAIPVANIPQFRERTQFISPVDDLNLNDSFPGDQMGSFTKRLAYTLSEVIKKSDAYVDCHGGDLNEDIMGFVVAAKGDDTTLNNVSLEMAKCYNTGFIHQFSAEPGLSISVQKLYGVPSIMPEAGTPFPVREESVEFHVDGLMNLLRYFQILPGDVVRYQSFVSPERIKLYSSHDGVWKPFVELNQRVKEGELLGAVRDHYGDLIEEINSPKEGIIGMRRCYYSVKKGEMLVVLSTI